MKIILASASPRRKEILEKIKVKFDVLKSNIDETYIENEIPESFCMRLSFEKGYSVSVKHKDDLIISADTIVVYNNKIFNKPKDELEAIEMIKTLSGKTHQVITGFSLINLSNNKKIVDFVVSEVKFKNLSNQTILDYIKTGEYKDKAGAYGIQGYGSLLVESINGDYFNIVGLPISRIYDKLKTDFNIDIFMEGDISEIF